MLLYLKNFVLHVSFVLKLYSFRFFSTSHAVLIITCFINQLSLSHETQKAKESHSLIKYWIWNEYSNKTDVWMKQIFYRCSFIVHPRDTCSPIIHARISTVIYGESFNIDDTRKTFSRLGIIASNPSRQCIHLCGRYEYHLSGRAMWYDISRYVRLRYYNFKFRLRELV